MPRSVLTPLLALWSSAQLGCAAFLLIGLLPRSPLSFELLAQLSWLALIGSVPTTLALGSAAGAARATRRVAMIVALAIGALGMAVAWEHTDFLLSGPGWMLHPQRRLVQVVMAAGLGSLAAAGWLWLIVGARAEARASRAIWAFVTSVAVAGLTIAIARYRAYDYTLAQAVFPGGVLCAAVVHLVYDASSRRGTALLGVALASALVGAGLHVNAEWIAMGEREVIAHSRAGGLVTLYVLPHLGPEDGWSDGDLDCPPPRPFIDESPLWIPASQRRNVIIITVDALRKDVVDAEESGRPVMPELSRLSRLGISFENATTTYPATLFAVGSAFTGLTPAELYLSPAMPETIFTRARARVDRQLAILPDVSWFRLPIVRDFLVPGVRTGFARSDAEATSLLVRELRSARARGESVMAWVHYYAPHDPYQSHPSFPFGKGRKKAYLSEVAYFDQQLGNLVEYLEREAWLEDTLVVFFSDHGEAMGEKAYFGHHVYLDGWMVDVPLVLWHASFDPVQPRVGVSVADVAPTVLHFLGVPQPSDLPAQSLLTLDPDAAGRGSFSEAFPVRGEELFKSFRLPALDEATIRDRLQTIRIANKGYEPKGAISLDGYRLIHHRGAGATLIYERAADGRDRAMTGEEGRKRAQLLRSELEQWEREQLRRIQCRLRLNVQQ
jgi:hypothetical protein